MRVARQYARYVSVIIASGMHRGLHRICVGYETSMHRGTHQAIPLSVKLGEGLFGARPDDTSYVMCYHTLCNIWY